MSSKIFSYGLRETNVRKDLRLIHERLKMGSYTAEVFSAVFPRMRILKLNARSRAPGFAYIHAPPLIRARNRSDVCSQNRPNPRESNSKASHVKAESEHRSSKQRPNFTGAEV